MKKIVLLFCGLIYSSICFSQVPNWSWANRISGSSGGSGDVGVSVTTDNNGNVIVVGQYTSPTISFGTLTLSNSSTNSEDVYIAKYSPSGTLIWAKTFGGNAYDYMSSVTTDNTGNIIFTGNFWSTNITFGSKTLTNYGGGNDGFVVKLDALGTVLWANKIGGTSQDNCKGVKTDSNRNVIITGEYGSAICNFGTNSLSNMGSSDIYVAKYNETGDLIWAKRIAGTSNESSYDLTTDISDNVILTGSFGSTTLSIDANNLSNTGVSSMFLIKLNSSGIYSWSKTWSGSSLNRGVSVATDNSGNVFLLGSYGDTSINFDGIILNCSYTSHALVKYNSSGNIQWAKTCSGGQNEGTSLSVDSQGNSFVSGYFICPQINFGTTLLNNSGGYDGVLVKYDSNGNEKWGKIVGGNLDEFAFKVVTDLNDNQVLIGKFMSSSISFGSITITNAGTGSNSNQIFISKLNNANLNINEFQNENYFTIYPNPIYTESIINFTEEQLNTKIEIIDILGNVINSTLFNGNKFIIEKNDIKSGIYLLRLTNQNNDVITKKIIFN